MLQLTFNETSLTCEHFVRLCKWNQQAEFCIKRFKCSGQNGFVLATFRNSTRVDIWIPSWFCIHFLSVFMNTFITIPNPASGLCWIGNQITVSECSESKSPMNNTWSWLYNLISHSCDLGQGLKQWWAVSLTCFVLVSSRVLETRLGGKFNTTTEWN